MASNKIIRIGPLALTATYTTNIFNPGTTTGGVNSGSGSALYAIIRHIRIVNKTTLPGTFRLYIGATGANAAGTEFMGYNKEVPANDSVDWYGALRLDTADFLVGGASALTTLTFEAEAELGVL